jgi:tRNA(Ile)-lysidine synthase TilS/MesJ
MYIDIENPNGRNWVIRETLRRTEAIFDRFPHLAEGDAVIAFSGGKDSVALADVMRQLGRTVQLRAVDMGYSPRWGERVHRLADKLRVPIDVIRVAEVSDSGDVRAEVRADLHRRWNFLKTLEHAPPAKDEYVTPCTNCYNCKLISLTELRRSSSEILYFGHHGDDMLSSFLKSCLMYYDRWYNGHSTFTRDNFTCLLQVAGSDLANAQSLMAEQFLTFLAEGWASTEEPVYEEHVLHGRSYRIGRPLLAATEDMLRSYSDGLGLQVESSGCGHSKAQATRTPRELVQFELLPALRKHSAGRENLQRISAAIFHALTAQGSLRVDARRGRDALLGEEYKGGVLSDKY